MKPADITSDPDFARALFSGETAARSLVREAIQNSLDARAAVDRPVIVRFAVRDGSRCAPASAVTAFTQGIWEHLDSSSSGLTAVPETTKGVSFLVIEDFGTRGLTGDPEQWDPFASQRNAFFLFFRALGRSGKTGEERGRWGVGKFVFPLASHGHALFGYTIAADSPEPLLMGRTVLRTHQVHGASYHPDGHWGKRDHEDALVAPEKDATVLQRFRQVFCIRRVDEPGLSVVVPWRLGGLDGRTIIEAVVAEYFVPILRSELIVEVDNNEQVDVIDSDSITQFVERIESKELRARIYLALEAATWPTAGIVSTAPVELHGEPDWATLLPDHSKAQLLRKLDEGSPVAIRIPVTVRLTGAPPARSSFDLFLQRADGVGRSRPLIVREGIAITEDKTSPVQEYVSLILIDHGPLATFVGDAETPAHTTLQHELVSDKYTLGKKLLTVIRTSAAALLRSLEQTADEDDFALLADFFPISDDEGSGRQRTGRSDGTGAAPSPVPAVPVTPPRYRLTQSGDGFRVTGTGNGELPPTLTIRFAYDVRRGNPFKRYSPLDFSLLRRDLKVAVDGASVVDKSHNIMVVQPTVHSFQVGISGFDPLRDLIVRVDAPASVTDV